MLGRSRVCRARLIVGPLLVLLGVSLGLPAQAEVRTAKVAGVFYPAEPRELRALVTELLEGLPAPDATRKPRILIAPHAGYRYSGPVAAAAFRQVRGHRYDAVVVVGFTHQFGFPGASVDTREAYETPLGTVPVDLEGVGFLQAHGAAVSHHEPAHAAAEHSLEVMLPFLQVALGDFELIPVLMGGAGLAEASGLADALAALAARGEYLFVFSTDLSHYHPHEDALTIDERTVNAVVGETGEAVSRLFEHGVLEACGRGPIVAGLLLAARLGYPPRELLAYANSGDTAGDRSRVVGYAAMGVFDRDEAPPAPLSEEAGMALVRAARETLERALLAGEAQPTVPQLEAYPELAQTSGIFVTLRREGLLCGCIGRIESDGPLAKMLPVVALDAALRDARFPPVQGEDLSDIHVEVSVLTRPTRLADVRDLVPGRDGVVLESQDRTGVFLPTVWKETGWTRVEFLRELASQKAGLAPEAWREATLYVFQDQVFEEP